jgi:hypothetical protein
MDFMPKQIFHREIERQCKFALMAYDDLKQTLAIIQQPQPEPPVPNSSDIAQIQATMARRHQWLKAMDEYDRIKATASERFWYSVQAFLGAAGNISKLLWPSYRREEKLIPERGPELRASLAVEADSPLAPRTFRNHFEHFDVRLEEWAVSSKPRIFIDANIAPTSMTSGYEPGDRLRNFDPYNFTITFRGDSYHLPPIVEAIEQLWQKAKIQLQQRASA